MLYTVFFIVLVAFLPRPAFAQDSPYLASQRQFDLYGQAHTHYIRTKQAYTTYQTLTTKEEALLATKAVLWERNQALKAYIDDLITDLSTPTPDKAKATTFITTSIAELTDWQTWLSNQQGFIDQLNNIPDINNYSKAWQEKYRSIEKSIYQALVEKIIKNGEYVQRSCAGLIDEIARYPAQAILTHNWLGETNLTLDLITEKFSQSRKTIQPSNTYYTNFPQLWLKAKETATAASNYEFAILNSLEEIISYLPQ